MIERMVGKKQKANNLRRIAAVQEREAGMQELEKPKCPEELEEEILDGDDAIDPEETLELVRSVARM